MNKKTPLLVITELFLPTKGGTAVWFAEVYRRLGGKEIHIVTADVPGAAEVDAVHPNTIHRLNLNRVPWLKPESLVMYWRLFARALRLTLQNRFKGVHAGRVLPEGFVAWLVARIARIPVVIYAHGEEITRWRQPRKFRAMCFTYRHADHVVANSDFTRNELVKLGVDPARIVLISPGADTDRFRPRLPCDDLRASLNLKEGQKLILSVGRLNRRKGFDQVIKALPKLLARGVDIHYAIVGIGEDHAYLQKLAAENGVAERVHLLGHVPMEDLPRWYNAADIFAMPNREIDGDIEGFGMVFLEAAACRKPVLAGISGGTGAAVEHGVTGLRIEGNSTDDVAEGLAKILGDDEYAMKLGQNGYERAHQQFSWEAIATKTKALIGNI
ncbi:MAG: glycosyltransferase family 4 protein [Gammaproteobacteria bacterium]|nr:glycosyltransferase family 4 protein [Gammaproteobacteria bacterium]